MIEDKLSRHYQSDALPAGHPVREACDELRRLRDERDHAREVADLEALDARQMRAINAELVTERDALLALLREIRDAVWDDRNLGIPLLERIDAALAKEPK